MGVQCTTTTTLIITYLRAKATLVASNSETRHNILTKKVLKICILLCRMSKQNLLVALSSQFVNHISQTFISPVFYATKYLLSNHRKNATWIDGKLVESKCCQTYKQMWTSQNSHIKLIIASSFSTIYTSFHFTLHF